MWAVRPAPHDEDRPIDLRKEAVLLRERARQEEEEVHAPDYRWQHQSPIRNLYPFMSEKYGVRCSIVTSDDSYDEKRGGPSPAPKTTPTNIDPAPRRSALETAIRKLHHHRQQQTTPHIIREERCKSTGLPEPTKAESELCSKRSSSCPNLALVKPRPTAIKPKSSFMQRLADTPPIHISPPPNDDHQVTSSTMGGAKKRKCFVPVYGDQDSFPRTGSHSPPTDDAPPLEDYYNHPEVILRSHTPNHAPYLLHVYDYYQRLVERLRTRPPSGDDDGQGEGPRKRPCRALTGKHVRQGTGASLSTLLTLRQKIQARQRMKEDEPHGGLVPKRNKPQKTKYVMNKIKNC